MARQSLSPKRKVRTEDTGKVRPQPLKGHFIAARFAVEDLSHGRLEIFFPREKSEIAAQMRRERTLLADGRRRSVGC